MIPTTINGRWTLKLPEHRAARPEWETGWERERLDSMHANIRPGDVVYDVGAEEGDLPALWASWGAEVYLFEPNPRVWPNIRAIFEGNDLRPLACWVGFAAEDDHFVDGEQATETWPPCAFGDVIGDHGFQNLAERPDRPRVRIDTAAAHGLPPDVITIDAEGSELRVLRGAERVLGERHPLVYASIHPEFMAEMYGDEPEDLVSFMAGLGYAPWHLATDHEQHFVFCHPEGRPLR